MVTSKDTRIVPEEGWLRDSEDERIIPEEGWQYDSDFTIPEEGWAAAVAAISPGKEYTNSEKQSFHRRLDNVNNAKRNSGRAVDVVSHADLDKLIDYAEGDDENVTAIAIRGLLMALQVAGTAGVVRNYMLRAASQLEMARRLLFATRIASGIRRSVGLISTIPDSAKPQLAQDIWRLARGKQSINVADLAKLLVDEYGLPEGHARLVALDQSRKYEGTLAEARQITSGVSEYIWDTMKDDRVRPSHRIKQGRKFRWDSPPPDTGHPGEDINCRCMALPVLIKKRG